MVQYVIIGLAILYGSYIRKAKKFEDFAFERFENLREKVRKSWTFFVSIMKNLRMLLCPDVGSSRWLGWLVLLGLLLSIGSIVLLD